MTSNSRFGLLSLLAFIVAAAALPIYAQSGAPPLTVVDYYLRLPDKYTYEVKRDHREELLRPDYGRLRALDIKNGYLDISGDAGDPGLTVALFKRPDGERLVAVDVFNELAEELFVLRYREGKWTDVTKTVIPDLRPTHRYQLPRYGTTIKVNNEAGVHLYNLVWAGGRFTIKR